MSKILRPIQLIPATFVLILQFFTFAVGQDVEVTITIDREDAKSARIEGRFIGGRSKRDQKTLEFLSDYGDAKDLDERISGVHVVDPQGKESAATRFADSYWSDTEIRSWSYKVDLTAIKKTAAASRVSWLGEKGGVLMLADIVPYAGPPDDFRKRAAKVRVVVPGGWKVYAAQPSLANGWFDADVDGSSFVVGPEWRSMEQSIGGATIRILLADEWSFSDAEASSLAREVYSHYLQLFGTSPRSVAQIVIHKFQFPIRFGAWEADARGSSITIVSSDMPFKSQSLQRLHEQLRHEVFHFWIPNGVNLPGAYDWFYEGFALYQSLKLGVSVGRIRFEDMLNTLSRAYDIDAASKERIPLLLASERRWSGQNTTIYARGMLIAFLCDMTILNASKGKASTDDFLKQFYADFQGPNPGVDGYAAVTGSLYRHKTSDLQSIVDRYIGGSEPIDWVSTIAYAGLEGTRTLDGTRLSVKSKLSGRQKDLLDKLGYNKWRKLANGK